jgi:hypothetical protein
MRLNDNSEHPSLTELRDITRLSEESLNSFAKSSVLPFITNSVKDFLPPEFSEPTWTRFHVIECLEENFYCKKVKIDTFGRSKQEVILLDDYVKDVLLDSISKDNFITTIHQLAEYFQNLLESPVQRPANELICDMLFFDYISTLQSLSGRAQELSNSQLIDQTNRDFYCDLRRSAEHSPYLVGTFLKIFKQVVDCKSFQYS